MKVLPTPQVGPTYGRLMMTGYLAAQGIMCAERRVGATLRRVNPPYNIERRQVTCIVHTYTIRPLMTLRDIHY